MSVKQERCWTYKGREGGKSCCPETESRDKHADWYFTSCPGSIQSESQENKKTSGQENICFDLLLSLKVWFSFVIVFCAPYLSSLLFLQQNKLAIV